MIHKKGGAYGINKSMSCLRNKLRQNKNLTVNRHELWESQMIKENPLKSKGIQKYVFVNKTFPVFTISF